MESNSKTSYTAFKSIVLQGLKKVDIDQIEQRNRVYTTAIKSLEKAHQKNVMLSEAVKSSQRVLIKKKIDEIETQFLSTEKKRCQNSVVKSLDISGCEPLFLGDDDLVELNDKLKRSFSSQSYRSKTVLLTIIVGTFLILSIIKISFFSIISDSLPTDELRLPYILQADETLFKSMITKGTAKVELLNDENSGILYEAGLENIDKSSSLDIILRGNLAKKFNAITEPFLVNFHIKKQSKEDFRINFLVRGSGKPARKSVEVLDHKVNQYFIVMDVEQLGNPRSFILIRLQIPSIPKKDKEKAAFIIKKIVLSRI